MITTVEIRKYHEETYDPETGMPQYTVVESFECERSAIHYLTPPGDCQIVDIGTRAEQIQSLVDIDDLY